MRGIKELSQLTGISIRTLRYYDEIGLLKPTGFTEAGYRLYDDKALERLQEILFFKEMELSLGEIRVILDNPEYDRKQVLFAQKEMLIRKRNRLNGILELLDDVMEGVNTMSFEAFSKEDVKKMVEHTLQHMSKEALEEQIKQFGSLEAYRQSLEKGFEKEQAVADLIKWYGSKDKVVEAVLQSTGNQEELKQEQDENAQIYAFFAEAKKLGNADLAQEAVSRLADCYKKMFVLDNARSILLDLAKEYLQGEALAKVTDEQWGEGMASYVGEAIQRYYGV
ncbi:MAG: MerR family transcriptional regulator [Lachnospiraceae bacterium]|nr:MerR family transcriptional regulator [Lachnospiraceae bacterium]